jgi:hypothetical protein
MKMTQKSLLDMTAADITVLIDDARHVLDTRDPDAVRRKIGELDDLIAGAFNRKVLIRRKGVVR